MTPAELLAAALAIDPARPLITFYDDASGERTELSVATFANWVAKTANLLVDDLAVEPGATVAVALPLHWQTLVWVQAAWSVGSVVELVAVGTGAPVASGPGAGRTGGAAAPPAVAVVSHDADPAGTPLDQATDVVSLGLHPFGLPRPGDTPASAGALDYDRSVHAHADRFTGGPPPDPQAPALRGGAAEVTAGALARAAAESAPDLHGYRLLVVTDPVRTVTDVVGALLVPLVAGGAVLVRHADPAATTAERLAAERVGAVLGGAPGAAATAAAALPAAAGLAGFTPRLAGIA